MSRYALISSLLFLYFSLFFFHSLVFAQLSSNQRTTIINVSELLPNNTTWSITKDPNPCSWKGVSCSPNDSSITHLSLSGFGLSASNILPPLCQIDSLESLDLSDNHLSSIPDGFITGCGGIDGLKLLNFSKNKLSGSLPTFNGFVGLQFLDLSFNYLNGSIDLQLDALVALKSLNLSSNHFNGSVPPNLGKSMVLEKLILSINSFQGGIPKEISNYRNLTLIDFSVNHFSGSLPNQIGGLSKLEVLIISSNNLSGPIPNALSNITTLWRFAANQNNFSGNIPNGISRYLRNLDLSYNKLSGPIPSDLLSQSNLQTVDLSYNLLEGSIPANISTTLLRLRLGSNRLSGVIPAPTFATLETLIYLELENNSLTGSIPSELGSCQKLALLNLAQNKLSGVLPEQLGNLSHLQVMKLQSNNLVGEIPTQITQLPQLSILNISWNSLSGLIPSSLSSLQKLTNLNLQGNNLNGSIPRSIFNLGALLELQLGKNKLSGPIPMLPESLQIALNLSSNFFEGTIPATHVDDREQDIKPTFASNKAARLTTNANGETVPVSNGTPGASADDDDLSEGEIDDFDDDDEFGDPEEQWNLRKCSAAALDVLASVFHEAVFQATLPYLTDNLNHAEWPNRESAVLALGAIADGCMSVVEPHLPMLTPFLITLLNDPKPVVRQITCWTLGRYSGWAAHLDAAGKKQFFEPVMEGILMKMLDRNKRVQEAAASAFANLEEKANTELEDYCGVIVQQFVQCFSMYKDRNMFILYDCVQTLAEHVGPKLSEDKLVQTLMPALLQRWNKVSDQSREMFPLLECLSYVATALGHTFAPYAAGIFARCMKIIHRNLEEGVMAAEINGFEPPDKDFLVTSLDLLSAIIQALSSQDSATLVSQASNFFELLVICMRDQNNDVRQSAYALLGDCAIYVFQQLKPHLQPIIKTLITQLEVSQIDSSGLDTGYSVINNACWSVGEIAMCEGEGMQPYVGELLQKLGSILFDERVPESLNENAAIALGRLGLGCAPLLAPHLAQIAPPFLRAIRKVQWTDEKCHALTGFMLIVLANPGAMEQSLLEFFNDMSMADRNVVRGPTAGVQVYETFQKVIQTYKGMIGDFDAFLGGLPAEQQARFRDLYSV